MLKDISPYVYGTTRLGDDKIAFADRVKMAHTAMDSGVWFHTSHAYGDALKVLRTAFDEERNKVPKLIVKIGWNTADELRNTIIQHIDALAVDNLELGQLCLSGELAEEFANGGKCYEAFAKIKEDGLVNRFVVEVFPWTSNTPLKALRSGYPKDIVDGYIFYLNPLQRFASNELWDLLVENNETTVAMRTVSGGNVHALRDVPCVAWKPYLQERAVEVAPIFERSGVKSWTEFCIRFAHSFPQVRASVGATSNPERFQEFIDAAKDIKPLPEQIVKEITALQYRWSDELDVKAEPWTM